MLPFLVALFFCSFCSLWWWCFWYRALRPSNKTRVSSSLFQVFGDVLLGPHIHVGVGNSNMLYPMEFTTFKQPPEIILYVATCQCVRFDPSGLGLLASVGHSVSRPIDKKMREINPIPHVHTRLHRPMAGGSEGCAGHSEVGSAMTRLAEALHRALPHCIGQRTKRSRILFLLASGS